jgi:hypothetical protein
VAKGSVIRAEGWGWRRLYLRCLEPLKCVEWDGSWLLVTEAGCGGRGASLGEGGPAVAMPRAGACFARTFPSSSRLIVLNNGAMRPRHDRGLSQSWRGWG